MIIDTINSGKGNANEIAKKINIFNAIHMMFNAWNRVSTACITKCFRKAGMCSFSGCGDDDDYDGNDSYDEEFNDWITVDDDLPIYHTMEDGEIVDAVLEERKKESDNTTFPGEDNDGDDDDEEEEEEEERKPIKKPKFLNAVDFLRRVLKENEIGYLYFTTINEIEAKLLVTLPQKQSVITDFLEIEIFQKEVTYTPRLLLTDLKDSFGVCPQQSVLYDEILPVDVTKEFVLWPKDKIQVEYKDKYEKNEFLEDLENQENKMNDEETVSFENLAKKYELNDQVRFWSDYLGTRFHPRTVTIINNYEHDGVEYTFNTYYQGTELWKTDLFLEDWCDKCRAYSEECDYLQGFQMLFDCVDGFSGLSCSALVYLQDEFPNKSILSFPTVASWYSGNHLVDCLRTVNSVFSFSELNDLSTAFVPLCTNYNSWNEPKLPRKFQNLLYNDKLFYHTSAILATFLDTVSISYRLRKNITRLSSLLSNLSPCGRKLLSGTLRLPFPVYPELSILECLESLEMPLWTSVTPKNDITVDSSDMQEVNIRGLSSFKLLPSLKKRILNTVNQYTTVEDLLHMYLDFCSSNNRKLDLKINSVGIPVKFSSSFPNIFESNVTRTGCISPTNLPFNFPVKEAPVLSGLHNSTSASHLLTYLYETASKINLHQIHHLQTSGFERLEYAESLEKLLTLRDNYN
ncbi:hypothetical protein PGB90_010533 [Kerria lacca]